MLLKRIVTHMQNTRESSNTMKSKVYCNDNKDDSWNQEYSTGEQRWEEL